MFLKKITLTNFRQFYGVQELNISSDPEKNVTLIHAENGVGKTTLLNAILWCFYKYTTPKFEKPEEIVNYQAISEGNKVAKVEVLFDHDGQDYLVTRDIDEKTGDSDFKAFLVEKGNFTNLDNPHTFVDSVVPREMAPYYFFDGEYAETFSGQGNKTKVRKAVEDMLGCSTANQAIDDLDHLQREIEKQVAALTNNNPAADIQKEITTLETQNEKERADIILAEDNLEAAKSARDEIRIKLRDAAGASEIQKSREGFEAELARQVTQKVKREAELTGWLNNGGFSAMSRKLEEKTQTILKEAKIKGKIPSYIAERFVDDILESHNCICDRPFQDGSPEAKAIKKLLDDAGNETTSDRLMAIRAAIETLADKRDKSLEDLSRIKDEIKTLIESISVLESKIADCAKQLKGSNITEIAEREAALEARDKEIDGLNIRISRLKFDCEERDRKIEKNKGMRDKLLHSNERAAALRTRRVLLSKTVEKIKEELAKYRDDSRNEIAADVNKILEATARRDYVATIDDKFSLDLYHKQSKISVAKSSGENQLLSLAFIASLIKFSAKRIKSESEILKPGTSAPLVLDSPFGQLDPTYQQATSRFLPEMAKQVIMFLSKTQGNPEVMQILTDKIGSEYILISENTESQGSKPSDIVNVKGKEIPSSLYGCEKMLTRIYSVN